MLQLIYLSAQVLGRRKSLATVCDARFVTTQKPADEHKCLPVLRHEAMLLQLLHVCGIAVAIVRAEAESGIPLASIFPRSRLL